MSIAITTDSKQAWQKAIDKARATKPRVTVLGHGQFKVCGSKGDCYNVTWTGHKGEELKAECDCPAGRKDKPCYHIPPTAGMFKLQVRERAEKARPTCQKCGAEVYLNDLCRECFDKAPFHIPAPSTPPVAPAVAPDSLACCLKCGEVMPQKNLTAEGLCFICTPELPLESAMVDCAKCGEEWPEASMTGPGYAPICPDCLLFG